MCISLCASCIHTDRTGAHYPIVVSGMYRQSYTFACFLACMRTSCPARAGSHACMREFVHSCVISWALPCVHHTPVFSFSCHLAMLCDHIQGSYVAHLHHAPRHHVTLLLSASFPPFYLHFLVLPVTSPLALATASMYCHTVMCY